MNPEPYSEEGKALYERMYHLDPWPGGLNPWESLSEQEQDYYCTLAEWVVVTHRSRQLAAQRRGAGHE